MSDVQSIIESAYARSTANDPGKLAGDQELIDHLDRRYQSLYAIYAISAGDSTLAQTTLHFVGSPPTAVLPTDTIDIVRLETTAGVRAYVIPAEEKDRSWHIEPSVYRKGTILESRGLPGDPVTNTNMIAFFKAPPPQLVALSDTLTSDFPRRYGDILVLDLAMYLSTKDEGRSPTEYAELKTEYTNAMAVFNALTKNSNTTKESAKESKEMTAAG